jgi:hypothetical protein
VVGLRLRRGRAVSFHWLIDDASNFDDQMSGPRAISRRLMNSRVVDVVNVPQRRLFPPLALCISRIH